MNSIACSILNDTNSEVKRKIKIIFVNLSDVKDDFFFI